MKKMSVLQEESSMGVIGMKLDEGDEVVAMQLDIQGEYLLIVSENGYLEREL